MKLHMSIDDFISSFLDLRDPVYASPFDQPNFALLKALHEAYGFVFSCYCFYESGKGSLADVPDRFASEFQQNHHWLRFGFHGRSGESNYGSTLFSCGIVARDANTAAKDYRTVIEQLVRITGGGACIDRFPRIHYYAGQYEQCRAWKEEAYGIRGLISSEDDRVCYYHDAAQWKQLMETYSYHDPTLGLDFRRTFLRLEDMPTDRALNENLSRMDGRSIGLIFTHETLLHEQNVRRYFHLCGQHAQSQNWGMGYFYDEKWEGVSK